MVTTGSEWRRLGDEVFERISPYEGDGLRNHCWRLHDLFCALLERQELTLDRDLAYVVAMVHDLGLVSEAELGASYLERSKNLFHRETRGRQLGVEERVVDECLLYNHRLRPVPGVGPEAECLRRAVWIEHSRGQLRYGLDRSVVRDVFWRHPRANLDAVLVDFAWRVLRHEPRTLVQGIFFGSGV